MPPTEQQDLAQSAAEGAAVSRQRASDILAERLPGLNDPNALADPGPGQKPAVPTSATAVPAPLHPPPTLHADHYSPMATPPANALTPGQAVVDPKYAPAPKPQAAAPAQAKPVAVGKTTAGTTAQKAGEKADTSAEVKPKHPASSPAAADEEASPAPAPAKPKTPKVKPPEPPAATSPEPTAEPPAAAGDGGQPH